MRKGERWLPGAWEWSPMLCRSSVQNPWAPGSVTLGSMSELEQLPSYGHSDHVNMQILARCFWARGAIPLLSQAPGWC